MGRLLFFVLLAFVVWFVVRWLASSRRGRGGSRDVPPEAASRAPEPMRQCAWCGAHVPVANALSLPDGRLYCGVPHRDAAREAGPPA